MADAKLGDLLSKISYKAEWAGKYFIKINPKNTTQKCSNCGEILETKLELKDRVFNCPKYNHTENRDFNASKNILNQGVIEFNKNYPEVASYHQSSSPEVLR